MGLAGIPSVPSGHTYICVLLTGHGLNFCLIPTATVPVISLLPGTSWYVPVRISFSICMMPSVEGPALLGPSRMIAHLCTLDLCSQPGWEQLDRQMPEILDYSKSSNSTYSSVVEEGSRAI